MSIISDKVAYLRGLADGLKVDDSTNEGKLITSILDVLSDIAFELEDDRDAIEELEDQMEAIDSDLRDLEEFAYNDDCDCDDCNCNYDDDSCDCHCNDHCGCDDDCDCDDNSSIGYVTVECPNCKKETSFDIEMFDESTNYIECPNCHEKIEIVYEDTNNCDCHCD